MISVVVPTYNEQHNIAGLVERAGKALASCGEDFEPIIVDDNSPDGTSALVRRLQAGRPGRVRTFSKLLDRLERYTARGQVVDVGCYTGVFLDLARQRGWRTLGVEPSSWAAQKARERGLLIIQAPFRKAGLPAESFDLVTMWDVIEHLHDPLGELREARCILKPGGILALSTINAGCLFARLAGRHWPWYMRMHFYYFTVETMTRMIEVAGFRVLAAERHQRIVSLRYLIEKAASLVAPLAALGRWIGRPFGDFYVTVDLGDIMNFYAARVPSTQASSRPF